MSDVVVKPNFLGKFFGKPSLTLKGGNIVFSRSGSKDKLLALASVRTLFQLKKRFLGYELRLEGSKLPVRYRFLKQDGVEAFQLAANKHIRSAIKVYLTAVFSDFNNLVKLRYPRDGQAAELRLLIEDLHSHYLNHKAQWQSMLSPEAVRAVEEILTLYPFDMATLRAYHEHVQLTERQDFFDTIEANPLTLEQRLAVIRSNDRNMVLAAAGTGKTSVMVAKALDLIHRNLAKPSEILILAYNRGASIELNERLREKAGKAGIALSDEPQIFTFHALGRQILHRAGIATQISVFAGNDVRLKQWVTEWIQHYVDEDPTRLHVLFAMISAQNSPLQRTMPQDMSAHAESPTTRQAIVAGADLLAKALKAVRLEQLSGSVVKHRLSEAGSSLAGQFAATLNALHKAYVSELKHQNSIDFDDLIHLAIKSMKRGAFVPQWKYVLVDEFQDISAARMAFIQSLITHGPSPSLTVVGDDWQSIYRFSGGKLELTTRFGELVGSYTETRLQKTFRYNSSIAETAGRFIMQNPEQLQKCIETQNSVDTSQIYLLDNKPGRDNGVYERVVEVVATIRAVEPTSPIAVIARYNVLLDAAKDALNDQGLTSNVQFWSFHKSKGLEADHCILIGFSGGRNGFPAKGQEHALIEALLPAPDSYAFSEERRLMYVGITRARHKCYIIADPVTPSDFVTELLGPEYNIIIGSSAFQRRTA